MGNYTHTVSLVGTLERHMIESGADAPSAEYKKKKKKKKTYVDIVDDECKNHEKIRKVYAEVKLLSVYHHI